MERIVPGETDAELTHEHVARYRFAQALVGRRRVLDLGCGTGYGVDLLSRAGARWVVGSDVALAALGRAQPRAKDGVGWCVADGRSTPFTDRSFDLVVAMEVIEHVDPAERFVAEARRVLAEDGLFVCSTPNRLTYRTGPEAKPNPFHVREYSPAEFRELLSASFDEVECFAQSRAEGASFRRAARPPRDGDRLRLSRTERRAGGDVNLDDSEYLVAVCGSRTVMRRLRLDDCFLVADSDAVRRRDDTIRSLQGELQERSAWALALDAEVADLGSRLLSIQRELEERTQWAQEVAQESERRGRSILDLQRELESRTVWARDIEAESNARQTSLEALQAQLDRGDGPLSPDPVRPSPPAGVVQPTALEPDSARELRALIAWQSESLRLQRRREVALESRLERLEAHSSELAQDVDALRFSPNALLRRWRQQRLANEAISAQLSALEGALSPTRYVLEMLWASRLWRAYARLRRTAESVPLIRRLRAGRPSVDLWAHGREQLDRAVTPHMPGNGVASRRALIVDHRLPAPDEDAASLRTLAVIDLLREQGFAVTFVPANLHASTPHVGLLLARGVEVPAAPRWTSIRDFLAQRGSEFDLAIVCRLHIAREYFDIVRALCPRARLIFDTVDLQHLRLARRAQVEQDAAMASEASRLRDEELELASCADATIVVSEFEERLLHESMPRLDVRLLSLIYDAADAAHDFEHRAGIYFVGGFEHPPNVDGMRWFLREVFPEVCRLLPDVRLSIAGSKMPEGLAAPDHPRITNCGHLADLGGLLTGCRLSIAPLRYGAGVKGKVLQSLAAGVPCVATSAAAEGIGLSGELAVLVADDPKAMAHRIVRLHEDSALWRRASRLGRELVRARFSTEVARSALVDLLRDLGLAEATRS